MSLIVNTYTCHAAMPREFSSSVRSATADVCYNVYQATATPDPSGLVVIFAHGSQFSKELWNYQIELLFAHYGSKLNRAIAVDSLNSGESAKINGENIGWIHSWKDLARDHLEVLRDVHRRERIQGPLFAIGHSMGGAVALFMAGLEPQWFAGIVVMDPVWGVDNRYANSAAYPASGKLLSALYKNAKDEFDSKEDYDGFMNKFYASRTFHPRIKKDVENNSYYITDNKVHMKATRAQQVGAYAGSISLINHAISTFKYTPVPVLVCHGSIADWNPPDSNSKLTALLPKGSSTTIEGGGHLVFYQKPEATMEAIYPFIDQNMKAEGPSDLTIEGYIQSMKAAKLPKL